MVVAQVLLLNSLYPSIQQNRPLNSQNAADSLQKYNLKKTAVQKALDALADSGQISFKEYGKQKIYLARQDQFDIPNSEELGRMKEENAKQEERLEEQRKKISEIEGGILSFYARRLLRQSNTLTAAVFCLCWRCILHFSVLALIFGLNIKAIIRLLKFVQFDILCCFAEIKALQSNLTLEQIRAREAKLSTEVCSLDM